LDKNYEDKSISIVVNSVKVLFGARQTWAHSEANIRKYLEALIFADYNMFTGTLFVNDLGSRHGMMGQNGISLIIYEEYVIRVCRQHSRIIYCEKLLSVLTGNDYDYVRLVIGSIPSAYYSIIDPYIRNTIGLSRSYGDLLREYEKLNDAIFFVKGPVSRGVLRRLIRFSKTSEAVKDDFTQVFYCCFFL